MKDAAMDIYCRFCGEPWDHDSLHEMGEWIDKEITYQEAGRQFSALGCGAFESGYIPPRKCNHDVVDQAKASMSSAMIIVSEHPEDWVI
jgi:hypothetical protein|tara:strand:+ start:463 stop:729 length:267 start_codon:yes stop_codon:yes gene_type:complete